MMGTTTAVTMQKGGVGKTTTAINLATGFALGDYSVLLVDLDPQSNATHGLGIETDEDDPTVYNLIFEQASATAVRRDTAIHGLDLVPASLDLNGARAELPRAQSVYNELNDALESIGGDYDRVFIDCPPSLGPLTLNALRAADNVLIPLQCEYYALEGLSQLWETVQRIRDQFHSGLSCLGILMTMYDARTNLSAEVRDDVTSYFQDDVLETVIPRNIRISEAPGFGEPVITHDPTCKGSNAYLNATEEVIHRER
jgi:chromosome partitioning protein